MSRTASRTLRDRATVAATLLVLTVGAAACTGEEPAEEPAAPAPSASAEPEPEGPDDRRLEARIGQVAGELPPERRRAVARSVGRAVNRWFVAAWVEGPHPRNRYRANTSFPGFSQGAVRSARGDKRLLTNQVLGPRIDGLRVARRTVLVDVFSPAGRPAGATARFTLVLVTSGKAERRVHVTGRLTLVPGAKRWRIVGYDVARETVPTDRRARRKERS